MSYRCYTLSSLTPEEGIDTGDYDCIVNGNGRMLNANLRLMPAMDDDSFDEATRAELSLAFLQQVSTPAGREPGAVVSVDPTVWQPYTEHCRFVLLDPGGRHGRVLLFIPPDCANVLVSQRDLDQVCTLSVSSSGGLVIGRQSRGAAMLTALGWNPAQLFEAADQEPGPCKPQKELRSSEHSSFRARCLEHPSAELRHTRGVWL